MVLYSQQIKIDKSGISTGLDYRQPFYSETKKRQIKWRDFPDNVAFTALRAVADHMAELNHQLSWLLKHLSESNWTAVTMSVSW